MRACVRDTEAEGEDVKGPLPGQYFPKEYWDVCEYVTMEIKGL